MTRIAVLGGGFAGMETVRCLERALRRGPDVEILLVSDENYLLFTPLLPQGASSMVEPRHIIQPIRDIRGRHRPFRFRRDRVLAIDLAARRVTCAEGDIDYDRLVIALGGVTPSFGRLMILEAGDEILRGVHPTLAARARLELRREGIDVRTDTRVTRVRDGAVEVASGTVIPVGLTVWAAGVKGHPVLAPLGVAKDRLGRVVVDRFLQVPGHPGVYGAGDAVTIDGMPSASIPIIPAALAHARLVTENLVADLDSRERRPIEFAPRGMLVSLGERDAVVEVMGIRFSGYLAWLLWNAIHLFTLVGVRKQIQVTVDWSLTRIFPRDSAIMRPATRCPICRRLPGRSEREAA